MAASDPKTAEDLVLQKKFNEHIEDLFALISSKFQLDFDVEIEPGSEKEGELLTSFLSFIETNREAELHAAVFAMEMAFGIDNFEYDWSRLEGVNWLCD